MSHPPTDKLTGAIAAQLKWRASASAMLTDSSDCRTSSCMPDRSAYARTRPTRLSSYAPASASPLAEAPDPVRPPVLHPLESERRLLTWAAASRTDGHLMSPEPAKPQHLCPRTQPQSTNDRLEAS